MQELFPSNSIQLNFFPFFQNIQQCFYNGNDFYGTAIRHVRYANAAHFITYKNSLVFICESCFSLDTSIGFIFGISTTIQLMQLFLFYFHTQDHVCYSVITKKLIRYRSNLCFEKVPIFAFILERD